MALLRKIFISLKLIKFNLDFFKHKSFNKYLLNDLCLKKSKLNLINFNEINIFRNRAKFEKTLLVCISNFKSMRLFKIFDNNVVFLLSCLKQSFFRDYYPMGNMDFYEDELRKEKYLIKLRDFFY